jgi:hypothetical protein
MMCGMVRPQACQLRGGEVKCYRMKESEGEDIHQIDTYSSVLPPSYISSDYSY